MKKKFKITAAEVGQRLDMIVSAKAGISRSQAQKLFVLRRIKVNDAPAKPSLLVQRESRVEIELSEPTTTGLIAPDVALNVLYEDDDIVAIDKPAGLAVHPTEGNRPQPTVAGFAEAKGFDSGDVLRPGIVHRLDKDTSGVLLIAKSPRSKAYLQQLFKRRQITKTYTALVSGRLKEAEAAIKLPIGRHRRVPTKRAVLAGSKESVTHYKVLKEYPGASLLEVSLETGRTHQIRVHLAHLGHPVVGDTLYGAKVTPELKRQFLHASRLEFKSPRGKEVVLESPLPADLQDYLEKLEPGL